MLWRSLGVISDATEAAAAARAGILNCWVSQPERAGKELQNPEQFQRGEVAES